MIPHQSRDRFLDEAVEYRQKFGTGHAIGVAMHDHIIIGKDGHASLKALRLI